MTTELLGFDSMDYNVVYAQMGRGKMERNVGFAIATIAGTIAKMAFDACLFNSQNFSFVKLPKECTTGSSIMPHKKNPDVQAAVAAPADYADDEQPACRLLPRSADYQGGVPASLWRTEGLSADVRIHY